MIKQGLKTAIKSIKKKHVKKAVLGIFLVCIFGFLCSIRFRLANYLFDFSIDTHDYVDFKDHKENLEKVIAQVDEFVENTPDFFETYNPECRDCEEGLRFYKKELSYPENIVIHPVDSDDWDEIRYSLRTLPDDGYYEIWLDEEYPDYIFFRAEGKAREIVYTRGGRPYRLINSHWKGHEYVRVLKLGYGWYDIRPEG
ncbi:MAG: hypothetical protein IJ036_05175 [Lachnospiraceae bacterium]|nr:hypothetical protein [Lachnospiraceae bacterium]